MSSTILQFKTNTSTWAASGIHPSGGAEWAPPFRVHKTGGTLRPKSNSLILLAALFASFLRSHVFLRLTRAARNIPKSESTSPDPWIFKECR